MSEKNRYKIIFIDDEVSTLTYLQYALDWEQLRISVCGTADEGRRGLALIKEVNPDIVITDIRMPKCSGLDILEEIRNESRKCRVIMLSAYAEFEYARDALELNAADYLLKPVDERKLEERIKKIVEELDHESRQEDGKFVREQEKILRKLLCSDAPLSEAEEEILRNMKEEQSCFISCVIMDNSYIANMDLAYEQLKGVLKSIMPEAVLLIVRDREIRGIIKWDSYQRNELKLKFELEKNGMQMVFGAAPLRQEAFRECDTQAYLARSRCFYSGRAVEWYEKDLLFASHPSVEMGDFQEDIEEYCMQKNWAGLEEALFSILEKEYARRLLPCQLARLAFDFFVCVKLYITKLYPEKTAAILRHLDPEYFEGAAVKGIFEKRIIQILHSIAEKMDVETQQQETAIIRKAVEYTAGHYSEADLSLQDVADYAGVSRNYFSTLFKEYKDKKYWDYLSEYRIEKAKKLLRETRMTNYEIALEIGYKSEYHFSRKFKVLTGMSPREYRR